MSGDKRKRFDSSIPTSKRREVDKKHITGTSRDDVRSQKGLEDVVVWQRNSSKYGKIFCAALNKARLGRAPRSPAKTKVRSHLLFAVRKALWKLTDEAAKQILECKEKEEVEIRFKHTNIVLTSTLQMPTSVQESQITQ